MNAITIREAEPSALVAWLRTEAQGYRDLAARMPKSGEKATAVAFAATCKAIADDLESAIMIGDVAGLTRADVLAEREACAKIADGAAYPYACETTSAAEDIAAGIRARRP